LIQVNTIAGVAKNLEIAAGGATGGPDGGILTLRGGQGGTGGAVVIEGGAGSPQGAVEVNADAFDVNGVFRVPGVSGGQASSIAVSGSDAGLVVTHAGSGVCVRATGSATTAYGVEANMGTGGIGFYSKHTDAGQALRAESTDGILDISGSLIHGPNNLKVQPDKPTGTAVGRHLRLYSSDGNGGTSAGGDVEIYSGIGATDGTGPPADIDGANGSIWIAALNGDGVAANPRVNAAGEGNVVLYAGDGTNDIPTAAGLVGGSILARGKHCTLEAAESVSISSGTDIVIVTSAAAIAGAVSIEATNAAGGILFNVDASVLFQMTDGLVQLGVSTTPLFEDSNGRNLAAPAIQTMAATSDTFITESHNTIQRCTNASTVTITVPSGSLVAGTRITYLQEGAGQVQIVGSGVTLRYPATYNPYTAEQWSTLTVTILDTNEALVEGDMEIA
jgi:hypothetical protein